MAVELALIDSSDHLLTALELPIVKSAQPHDANTFYRRRSVPGVGKIWARVLLDAIHAIHRFPCVPDCVSYCRLGTGAKASAGQR
jgi:hypothetical protein